MVTTVDSGKYLHAQIDIQSVPTSRPRAWLRKGWEDLRHHRGASLAHGALVAGLGLVLLAVGNTNRYLFMAAVSGFLLVGPIMTSGLCELSRRRAAGESADFDGSLEGLVRNRAALMEFGAILMGIGFAWFVLSEAILRSAFDDIAPNTSAALWGGLFDGIPRQIIAYVAIGGLMASVAFALSVVSVPLMLDRNVSARDAMRASLRAVRDNPSAMLLWSGLIVVLTAIGFLTFPLGMVVVVPLLGHATWHAYEDLVH